MTRRDFELKAAEYFLCGNDNIEEQYDALSEIPEDDQPHGIGEIVIWEPFEDYCTEQILEFISELADNYEELYNLGNEGRKESAEPRYN
jgi:hypothetical protein